LNHYHKRIHFPIYTRVQKITIIRAQEIEKCLVEVTQPRIEAVDSIILRKNKQTSSSHADMRRSISTKFCIMIVVVRAIISTPTFLGPINSLAARVIENLAQNTPTEVNCL